MIERSAQLSVELGKTIEPGYDTFVTKCTRNGSSSEEWTYIREDGSRFPVNLVSTCLRDDAGEISGYLSIVEDITERKQAESALKDARAFQDLILNSNPDYVFVKDQHFKIIQANHAFLQLYPKNQQDKIIGYTTVESYNQEEADAFLKFDRIAFKEGQSETLETIEFPDGRTRSLLTKKVRFHNALGEAFILGIARDVTERETLIRELQRSNEGLDEFAYIAAHDLKEPLRGIHNHTSIALREFGDQVPKENLRRLNRVLELTQHMESLVNDLLYFSRVGRSEGAWQITDLNTVLENILSSTPAVEEESISVNTENALPNVFCDRVRIGEVFRNLISNAIKYNDQQHKEDYHHCLPTTV